jgi:hypothetical protein
LDRNACADLSALEEFCAWHGADFGSAPSYLAGFDGAAAAELLAALPGLRARRPGPLRRADVPLDALTRRLADWRDQVVYGRGFVLLRRLPIERMAKSDIALGFAALSAHLGRTEPAPETLSGPDCDIALATGGGDLTALLCLNEPAQGFELSLASTVAVHNSMLADSPAQLAALYEAAAFARRGKRLFGRLAPEAARGTSRLAKAHQAAFACAETQALRLDFEPGDVLFLNNHHAVFGLSRRGAAGTFGSGGRVLRLALESGLVAACPQPAGAARVQPQGLWVAERSESQAA